LLANIIASAPLVEIYIPTTKVIIKSKPTTLCKFTPKIISAISLEN